MSLPFPSFYDPDQVGRLYLERSELVAGAARAYAKEHDIRPSAQDELHVAVFGIDVQVGFCIPGASLFVPGAVEDTRRAVEWMYRNLDRISGLHFSLDTHKVFQIFHPAWWVDEHGEHPAPLTPIYAEDVRKGRWRALTHPRESLEYCEKLEANRKYVLTIWPYHTLLGGVSHALVPAVMEAALFHSLIRKHQTHFETKGAQPLTENYSVLSPEVTELAGQSVGTFNQSFVDLLMNHDRIYVFGEAKSHCVLATLSDLADYAAANDPALADRIYILEDAMSPVPPPPIDPLPPALDFPRVADAAIERFRSLGMHVVRTSDPIAP